MNRKINKVKGKCADRLPLDQELTTQRLLLSLLSSVALAPAFTGPDAALPGAFRARGRLTWGESVFPVVRIEGIPRANNARALPALDCPKSQTDESRSTEARQDDPHVPGLRIATPGRQYFDCRLDKSRDWRR